MSMHDDDRNPRRALMKTVGAATLAGLAAGVASSPANAQGRNNGFMPERHDMDAWFDDLGGKHRVFVDSSTSQGGQDALRYAFNIMNSHKNAYGGSDDDYAMIVCYRHSSTPFGYGDALWEKYGEVLNRFTNIEDPETKETPKRNILRVGRGQFAGASIEAMVERGVHFAICATASRGLAGMIAGATGQDADDVYDELVAGAIPNAHFVPAGVMGATRAQEYGYSLLYAG